MMNLIALQHPVHGKLYNLIRTGGGRYHTPLDNSSFDLELLPKRGSGLIFGHDGRSMEMLKISFRE